MPRSDLIFLRSGLRLAGCRFVPQRAGLVSRHTVFQLGCDAFSGHGNFERVTPTRAHAVTGIGRVIIAAGVELRGIGVEYIG